jgi:chromosomal replication initiation ATPase DnaA
LSRFGETYVDAITNLIEFTHRKMEAAEDVEALYRASRMGIFGSEEFVKIQAPEINKEALENSHTQGVSIDLAINLVCGRFKTNIEALQSSLKTKVLVDARSVLCLLAHQAHGLGLSDVSIALGKNHGTVSRLAARANQNPRLASIVDDLLSASVER